MGNLDSPNQVGNKGDNGDAAPGAAGGSLVSPNQTGSKGNYGSGASQKGGNFTSPGADTNDAETKGHGDGRSSKGNDGKHHLYD
jgi:hypothetical protein